MSYIFFYILVRLLALATWNNHVRFHINRYNAFNARLFSNTYYDFSIISFCYQIPSPISYLPRYAGVIVNSVCYQDNLNNMRSINWWIVNILSCRTIIFGTNKIIDYSCQILLSISWIVKQYSKASNLLQHLHTKGFAWRTQLLVFVSKP